MRLEYLTFWFKWKKLIISMGVVGSLAAGYLSAYVAEETIGVKETKYYGTIKNIRLPGLSEVGCSLDCAEYLMATGWRSRPSTLSQLAPIVGGPRSMYQDSYIHQGFGGVLSTAEGTLISDLVQKDPAWAGIAGRVTSGISADLNNDGYNEFLFGLASADPTKWTGNEMQRYRISLEIVSPYSEKPEDYRSSTSYSLPRDPANADRRWIIDGDMLDVAAADFNNDGWTDIVYLGFSTGTHSWLGSADTAKAAGLEYTDEYGIRIGTSLNKGVSAPGQFVWSNKTSAMEAYMKRLHSDDKSASIKTHKVDAMDLDGDGNIDILLTGEALVVAWGDGKGEFTNIETIADTPGGKDSAVADFDNDGILDIVVYADSAQSGESKVYIGKNNRKYEALHDVFSSANPTSVTSLDVNGDGWLDMVFTCTPCLGPILETAVVNEGRLTGYTAGNLTKSEGTTGLENSKVVDVDLDGDMDILFSGRSNVFRQIWVNPADAADFAWLRLKVVGQATVAGGSGSAVKPLGAVVTITGWFGSRSEVIKADSNYVYFNLGKSSESTVDSVTIRWPYNNNKAVFTNVPVGKTTVLLENRK